MNDFSLLITNWYRLNKRDLPWRSTKNPYKIWLSETLLQQTRVRQGLPYYEKFIKNFPTIADLAAADEEKVLKLWQGLGYYSRARNLHHTARLITKTYDGKFPEDYKTIRSLKGVGDYTAAAIASFAFDQPKAVVDGNVYRVLSRVYNEKEAIDTTKGKKLYQELANQLLCKDNPAIHNQAIMELGAIVCKPKKPDCQHCPVNEICASLRAGTVEELPVKSKKTKVTKKYFYYLFSDLDNLTLEKREGGIWKNMYQLPLIESNKKLSFDELSIKAEKKYGCKVIKGKKSEPYKHILSHQRIFAEFWEVRGGIEESELVKTKTKYLKKYPFPRLIEKFLEDYIEDYHEEK